MPYEAYRDAILQKPEYKCGNVALDTVEERLSEGELHYDPTKNTCSRENKVIKSLVDNTERPPYVVSVSKP